MDYTQFVSDKSEMGEQVWLNPRIFLFLFIDGSQRVGQITIKDRGWKKKCRLQDPNPEFLLTGWGLWICISDSPPPDPGPPTPSPSPHRVVDTAGLQTVLGKPLLYTVLPFIGKIYLGYFTFYYQ